MKIFQKRKMTTVLMGMLFILIWGVPRSAFSTNTWESTLTLTGEDLGGEYLSSIQIGVGIKSEEHPALEAPLKYTSDITLWKIQEDVWEGPFSKQIATVCQEEYRWTIAVDPHGNMMPPSSRTAVLSWEPSEFGQGKYQIRKGYDGQGEIVIEDMNTTTELTVSGSGEYLMYSIIYAPPEIECFPGDIDHDQKMTLSDVIAALSITSAFPLFEFCPDIDVNNNGMIDQAEALYVMGMLSELRLNPYPETFTYTFYEDLEGWTADFADYPPMNEEIFNLDWQRKQIPENINQPPEDAYGLFITGDNRSDDLFMFIKKQLPGLKPSQTYDLIFEVKLATAAPSGCIGVGGAPGEDVVFKIGAMNFEPLTEKTEETCWVNFDKGNQSIGGEDAIVIGNIANDNTDCLEVSFAMKQMDNQSEPFRVITDEQGVIWVILGTDSGFEGRTELYYSQIEIIAYEAE